MGNASKLGFLLSTVSRKRSNQTELRAYMRMAVGSILPGAGRLRQCFAHGPSSRSHGLITGWRIFGVLSKRMEEWGMRVNSDFCFLPCQGSALTRLSYGPICGWLSV